MTVQSDKWIKKMSKEEGMISPFEEKQVRGDSISYGLSSFGYDARVSNEFKIFTKERRVEKVEVLRHCTDQGTRPNKGLEMPFNYRSER